MRRSNHVKAKMRGDCRRPGVTELAASAVTAAGTNAWLDALRNALAVQHPHLARKLGMLRNLEAR